MSATAFQRMRREAEARKLAEEKNTEEKKPAEPTNKELMKMLDELGIEYDKRANKATLISLLEQAQQVIEPEGGSKPEDDPNNNGEGAD